MADALAAELTGAGRDGEYENLTGQSIGPYLVGERLGEGGTGIVYAARQENPIRREVAIKCIKPGMDTREVLARFAVERQTLALLDHPGIARVIDAGATERGRPYFVMELVRGTPITVYCSEQRLSLSARLEIFLQICEAVEHAHQKGVIHRDLKPSNVLIESRPEGPRPKIIDFGIAKVVAPSSAADATLTQHAQFIGTPGYMSPEQAEGVGGLDTRSDIYSLGALLYELLTGRPPHAGRDWWKEGLANWRRHLRETPVLAPSALVARLPFETRTDIAALRGLTPDKLIAALRGDLDWITLRCLEAERERRYATAGNLANDIRLHLADEPVSAAAPSRWYRWRKSLRRHRLAYAAGAFVFLALATATVVSTVSASRARKAERIAATETKTSRAVLDFLRLDVLAQAAPDRQPDRDMKLRTALDNAAARIGNRFEDQPLVEAAIRQTIANTLISLGDYQAALPHFQRAWELLREHLGLLNEDTFNSLSGYVGALRRLAKFDEAEALNPEIEALIAHFGLEHPLSLEARTGLATMRMQQGRYKEALGILRETYALQRRLIGPDDHNTLRTMANLGTCLEMLEQFDEAEVLQRELLERRTRILGPDHPRTLNTRANLADVEIRRGNLDAAGEIISSVLADRERLQGPNHPDTIGCLQNLGSLRQRQGRYDDAVKILQESRRRYVAALGPNHPASLMPLFNIGYIRVFQGRPAEALESLRECLAGREAALGPEHPHTTDTQTVLAKALGRIGQYDEAEEIFQKALAIREAKHGRQSARAIVTAFFYGDMLLAQGRIDEAVTRLEQTVADSRATHGDTGKDTLEISAGLLSAYLQAGRPADAVKLGQTLRSGFVRQFSGHPALDLFDLRLGLALLRTGNRDEAEPLLRHGADAIIAKRDKIVAGERSIVTEAEAALHELDQQKARP